MPIGNGGVIGPINAPAGASASGVWSLAEAYQARRNGTWPQLGNYIPTPVATPSIGASFEGGFYTGLIWNQVTQSSTSTTIGTGEKIFTVADMSVTPLFYFGQTVEVRSRANPSTNRMIGTVTFALGTNVTINVTSVNGSGTFTDWSIMAKYRIIVSPKSSGENLSIKVKSSDTDLPLDCRTLTEGYKSTLAMVADGNSATYPAAHWCNDLSINGYTDWYLPARDEFELIWRNLKPTADNNYSTADRQTDATRDYQNLGSLGDTANTHGTNNNSAPQGAAYTSGSPSQTPVVVFQTGEAEAIEYGSAFFRTSTEYSTTAMWLQAYNAALPGYQFSSIKNNNGALRAVRRSVD